MKKIILIIFVFIVLFPLTASAQIITFDPVTAGIQSIIQTITAANTAIQAAESKIEVELSSLKYIRQGQQLMNQVQELQQESSSLMGAVNNIEGTVMMPAQELQGLKNSLTGEQQTMQNIISQERSNPQLSQYLQNYNNTYGGRLTGGTNTLYGAQNNAQYYGNLLNKYQSDNVQSAQTGAYAQNELNNSQNNQHLISQLGANISAAHGNVAAEQANGQALVALAEEVNQTNKLLAEQAKLQAAQAGTRDSQNAVGAEAIATATAAQPIPAEKVNSMGPWPNVTNFK